jgi:hypothetical protein
MANWKKTADIKVILRKYEDNKEDDYGNANQDLKKELADAIKATPELSFFVEAILDAVTIEDLDCILEDLYDDVADYNKIWMGL